MIRCNGLFLLEALFQTEDFDPHMYKLLFAEVIVFVMIAFSKQNILQAVEERFLHVRLKHPVQV
ncbi:hypothetical protein T265_10416 [Opisthorchis viverrini]|uniref:Uncharacterized protein n=1 Tax=Opisthorchis viverrini TaxID=6198 RepID=A0A074Z2D7_OPIVI|nr:hypothetical protein T265_10416 [Opisthorchis viverrini]KER21206.1 hypothetical protein T265_10416 [Opisthorchis viverrini]